MKDFHCTKETTPGERCGTILGQTDGRDFYFLTPGGHSMPVVLKMVPMVCPGCRKIVNWRRTRPESEYDYKE